MHRTSTLAAALVLLGSVAWGAASDTKPTPSTTPTSTTTELKPAQRAPKPPVPLADYFDIRRVRGASFSHDEKLVAYRSDEGGRLDIWVQPVEGGKATQVSQVKGAIHAFAFSPVNDTLLVEADEGGNDETRLYFTDSKGKPLEALLPDLPKGSRAGFIRWAPDGRSLLYIVVLPGQDFIELREYKVETRQSETILKSPSNLTFSLASGDLKRFVLTEILSDVNFNLYLFERGAKDPVLLTPHEGDVSYTATSFSSDGKTLYYTSTAEGEFTALYAMDLSTRTSRPVLRQDWDVERGEISPGGRYLVTVTNVDGTPQVKLQDPATGRALDAPRPDGEGAFVPVAFSRSDRYMAATLVTDLAPETLYVVDLQTAKATKMVEVLPASLRGRKMVAGKAVQIPTFDHWKVPALLYQPEGDGPFPAVIEVHGGPYAQAKRTFTGMRQYLVSKGYAVLVPNVRGSTGYGKTYSSLDNLDLGGGPLQDIVACKRWLIANAKVAPDRVAIMGASYGGYMALAAATFTPTEFAAHVDHFGITDLKALVESYPAYWAVYSPFTFKKYGNPKDPAHAKYQHDRSPINFVDRIQRPLLVVQGENDTRVPKSQSDRLVEALRGREVPVHYLMIPGEGHGFTRSANRLKANEATDRFLDRYLFGDTSVEVLP